MSEINALLQSKQNGNRSPLYIRPLKTTLLNFARGREKRDIASISSEEIEEYLSKFTNPGTRKLRRAHLSVLFAFSVRRGKRTDNPVTRIENVSVDSKAPAILTVSQVETLLSNCPTPILPYIVLGVFAGTRPMEVVSPYRRLDWKDVNLQTRAVSILGKRRRRMVPLEPRAVALLASHAKPSGPVCAGYHTVTGWMREKGAPLMGWQTWSCDILRHTAASMLIGLYQDVGKVATWLGHSPEILLTRYHSLVTKEDCAKFWACHPPESMSQGQQMQLGL